MLIPFHELFLTLDDTISCLPDPLNMLSPAAITEFRIRHTTSHKYIVTIYST